MGTSSSANSSLCSCRDEWARIAPCNSTSMLTDIPAALAFSSNLCYESGVYNPAMLSCTLSVVVVELVSFVSFLTALQPQLGAATANLAQQSELLLSSQHVSRSCD